MTAKIKKIEKLYDTMRQSITEVHALRKYTKETEVIFLECLGAYEKTTKMMLELLKLQKKLAGIYGL